MSNNKYDTLSQAVKELNSRGFKEEVKIKSKSQIAINGEHFSPSEIKITEYHRFEGMTNPADMSVIYAIESKNSQHKGILIDSYGAESSQLIAEFLKNVTIDE